MFFLKSISIFIYVNTIHDCENTKFDFQIEFYSRKPYQAYISLECICESLIQIHNRKLNL